MGYSQHAGVVIVCDGTPEAANQRLGRLVGDRGRVLAHERRGAGQGEADVPLRHREGGVDRERLVPGLDPIQIAPH